MKKLLFAAIMLQASSFSPAKADTPVYKNPKASVEQRVSDLMSRMTLKEKVMQLNQYQIGRNTVANNQGQVKRIPAEIGSLIYFGTNADLRNEMQHKAMDSTRLGIPILFAHDVIHGFRTIFPIPLAQACSFNPEIVRRSCEVAAQEAKMAGIDWTFSPMIDVARDPRWGRVAEGYGEDPYLAGEMGKAAVQGYQGNQLGEGKYSIAACLKHYVGYSASEAGRDYVYTEISNQTLWDTYLPPFIKSLEAHPATVMSSFNNISGIPASANRYTMREVLKEQLGFEGFVVSDWAAIKQLKAQGMVKDMRVAACLTMDAGLDMDMMSNVYDKHLEKLVQQGKVDSTLVDEAVARVLRVKFEMGLFEHPYTEPSTEQQRFLLKETLSLAEQVAEETMVLLKNERQVLPFKTFSRIALIGPVTKADKDLLGCWHAYGDGSDVRRIADAVKKEFKGKAEISLSQGCDFDGNDHSGFAEAIQTACNADVVVACLGEKYSWSGENASRASIELPHIQIDLLRELQKTGKPIVLVLSNGRPLQLSRMEPLADAIIEIWQPGVAGGKPIAGILSGRVNPSGRLAMTFPLTGGQIPIYYNYRTSGRPTMGKYHDLSSEPLYQFGHGLSYSQFRYGKARISKTTGKKDDTVTVEVDVTNVSGLKGKETVLWYIQCPFSHLTRPVRELRHFEKREIAPGETATYKFEIHPTRDLSTRDAKGQIYLGPGEYDIIVNDQTITFDLEE